MDSVVCIVTRLYARQLRNHCIVPSRNRFSSSSQHPYWLWGRPNCSACLVYTDDPSVRWSLCLHSLLPNEEYVKLYLYISLTLLSLIFFYDYIILWYPTLCTWSASLFLYAVFGNTASVCDMYQSFFWYSSINPASGCDVISPICFLWCHCCSSFLYCITIWTNSLYKMKYIVL